MNLTAGIDVGSTSIKAVVVKSLGGADGRVLGQSVHRIRRREVAQVVAATFGEACRGAGVEASGLDYVASTGDGDAVVFRTGHFYTMTTHARGGLHLVPEARAVVDVGALHARAIKIDGRGKVLGHRMTSQCASGSGQFLEDIARYLGVPIEDVGPRSLEASRAASISSICAVLAETDVINMVSQGIATSDILKGIHVSIAGRLAGLLRATGAEGVVTLTGGLARDKGLVGALEEVLDAEQKRGRVKALTVHAHPDAQLAGAIGAALLGAQRFVQLAQKRSAA